ncbi:MAG: gamma-glutamyl-gamma-aminobutyrate hydrolase family protein [Limosilactobacillus sp.]|uniref:gamma-glutamyl-gamma-aminobutyrate hydrolase family protein n=1 Tax=Limosilactobacillus sp. TaxID=2773925 RepID=UPI0026F81A89|nr:gamma-glutamyl-gamma-aminobutyrate hydrolase family protein [Limosilactobacillus sp.]
MPKPIIGISGSEMIDQSGPFPGYRRSYVNEDYVDSVVQNGGVPFIIPFIEDDDVIRMQMDHVDALILSGGHDVDPSLYHEEPEQALGQIWPARDHFDGRLLAIAEEKHIPVLGICRGFQLINVLHGGSLYQDLSSRTDKTLKHSQGHTTSLPTHTVNLQAGSHLAKILGQDEIRVNSFHHQLVHEVAPDLNAVAIASDGVVEGLESADGSVIGVQWHPEMLHRSTEIQNKIFANLIERAEVHE